MLTSLVVMGLAGLVTAAVDESPSARMTLTDMATQIISRSVTNSQVLSLNLTNLVILLIIKGLVYGATMWGGHGHQGVAHKARADDQSDEPFFTEPDAMIFTSYLMGLNQEDYNCLYRVACQDPVKSKQYLAASKLLLKTAKSMQDVIPYDERYEKLIYNIQDAINFGVKYGSCSQRFACKNQEVDKT